MPCEDVPTPSLRSQECRGEAQWPYLHSMLPLGLSQGTLGNQCGSSSHLIPASLVSRSESLDKISLPAAPRLMGEKKQTRLCLLITLLLPQKLKVQQPGTPLHTGHRRDIIGQHSLKKPGCPLGRWMPGLRQLLLKKTGSHSCGLKGQDRGLRPGAEGDPVSIYVLRLSEALHLHILPV